MTFVLADDVEKEAEAADGDKQVADCGDEIDGFVGLSVNVFGIDQCVVPW